ncbi:tumor necrosis factor receptor superfamily member 6B [Pangasianodon hypophthalmus]|uniref:tumor necrosis factor receptor superfamily member 6B n=1 Tax=Pangasianodon hypophthalmus TaxID=310915 RepID=UPI0023081135|nr:tumor necrosis factor receptor superfamily member 6B [Pangasianodon hypophthalmus]
MPSLQQYLNVHLSITQNFITSARERIKKRHELLLLTTAQERDTRAQAHMATREFILTVLVLYSSAASLVLAQNETTYLRELPSGQKLLCNRCPPGFHLRTHCTETQPTACQPCDVGFYTAYWNYISDCLPCSWCSSDHVVVQECTRSSNRVCECKKGFYRDSKFSNICRPHTVCPSGYGVKEKGTPNSDTVCEVCKSGYYSAGQPGNTQCVPHTECRSEEKLLFHGTNYVDNVCVTCNSITDDGWVKLINQPFIEIFKNHNTRKLHRFVMSLTRSMNGHVCRPVTDHDWILLLRQCLSVATKQQISSLPKQLHEFGLKNLATNMEQRIKRIQDEVHLCRNTLI